MKSIAGLLLGTLYTVSADRLTLTLSLWLMVKVLSPCLYPQVRRLPRISALATLQATYSIINVLLCSNN